MSRIRKITSTIGVAAMLLFVLGIALNCDDEVDNQTCESGCLTDYANELDSCEAEATSCMESCSSPDDTECMWECEDYEDECDLDMYMCVGGCPCADAMQDCYLDCDSNDVDCTTDCANDYADCAGADSPYTCLVTTCQGDWYTCLWECEDSTSTMSDYLNCRGSCHTDYVSCVSDCA